MTKPRTIITHAARIATRQHAVGFPEARLLLKSLANLRHDRGGKDAIKREPAHFLFGPPQDTLRASAPTHHLAVAIGADDRGVDGAINDLSPL